MKKGIIFDLDQTLVDSKIAEPYRGRNWRKANELIPSFTLYNEMQSVFNFIKENGIKVAIVSTSVSYYVNQVLLYFSIPYNTIIAFHDVSCIKPNPEGFIKACTNLKLKPEDVISFGDRVIDIQASKSAKVESTACLWGTDEKEELLKSKPDFIINSPAEIPPLIK